MDSSEISVKHSISEAKRLASLKLKKDEYAQKQKLISEALKSVDNSIATSKRIVFGDSSDEEPSVSDISKKVDLFGNNDEESNNEDNDEDLFIKNTLKGKGGEKLTKLQLKYGCDDRFKLDSTFLDDEEKEEEMKIDQEDLLQEKEKQLRLLSSIVGHDIESKQKTKFVPKVEELRPFQRFDPFNPEHVEWVKNHSKKDKNDEEEVEVHEEKVAKEEPKKAPIIDERRFFNVDADFMNELREKTVVDIKKETFNIFKKTKKEMKEAEEKNEEDDKFMITENVPKTPKINHVKIVDGKNPCFFFQHTDPIIKTKLQRYSVANVNVEKRKWTSFRLAFWKNARNIRKAKLKELEEQEKKLRYAAKQK